MAEDNAQAIEDELEALAAIFSDGFRLLGQAAFELTVQVPDGRDLVLECTLPASYPSETAPIYELRAEWLPPADKAALIAGLESVWEEGKGEVVVFKWAEWLRDEAPALLSEAPPPPVQSGTGAEATPPEEVDQLVAALPDGEEEQDMAGAGLQAAVAQQIENLNNVPVPDMLDLTLQPVEMEAVDVDQFSLGEMWQDLPLEHILREKALALMMGMDERLGEESVLRDLDEHVLQLIATYPLDHPIIVPDEYPTLGAAIEDAVSGQKIILRRGEYSLVKGVSNPTRVDRQLEIVGEDGVKLVGGLQLGFDSGGLLRNVSIEGHLWIYGGKWRVEDCTIRNKRDAAFVISNEARVRVHECFVGGWQGRFASHGWIIYGHSQVEIEACDVQFCTTAATFGGMCNVVFRETDLKDISYGFGVLHPGAHGRLICVEDCEMLRGRRMWVDHRRPLGVRGAGNVIHSDTFTEGYAVGELGETGQTGEGGAVEEGAEGVGGGGLG